MYCAHKATQGEAHVLPVTTALSLVLPQFCLTCDYYVSHFLTCDLATILVVGYPLTVERGTYLVALDLNFNCAHGLAYSE